jgi:hypothetical protein
MGTLIFTSSVVARLQANATGEQVAIIDVSLDASANYLAGQFGMFLTVLLLRHQIMSPNRTIVLESRGT